jgi:hypothetical protein
MPRAQVFRQGANPSVGLAALAQTNLVTPANAIVSPPPSTTPSGTPSASVVAPGVNPSAVVAAIKGAGSACQAPAAVMSVVMVMTVWRWL